MRQALVLLGLFALGCQSTEPGERRRHGEPEPFVPLPDPGPESIGYFLATFDRSLQQWSDLKLAAASTREQNALQALELSMRDRARKRRDELVQTLEAGAPMNRRIAAAALGFTQDPTVLGALVATLEDPDVELIQKALLGIGVLALPETPLPELRTLLLDSPESWTRNNAAFALLSIARAGARSRELAEVCRAGLADAEAGVRTQCASALGVMADADSVPSLAELLQDEANLAALAAAVSLASIGKEHLDQKGAVARALALRLEQVKPDRRTQILGALRWLSDTDLGERAGPWLEWAGKLP
jgi:HEAT repeat protein